MSPTDAPPWLLAAGFGSIGACMGALAMFGFSMRMARRAFSAGYFEGHRTSQLEMRHGTLRSVR